MHETSYINTVAEYSLSLFLLLFSSFLIGKYNYCTCTELNHDIFYMHVWLDTFLINFILSCSQVRNQIGINRRYVKAVDCMKQT